MAPSIPTHRPLVTATRVAVSIAIVASASSLYLALGSAWAFSALPTSGETCAAVCPVAQTEAQASARGERGSVQ
jgi:hypothetical protein